MAYTTINKHTDFFNTKLYTGNASSRTISGIGFQPDLTWSKNRGNDDNHYLFDSVRGATKALYPDTAGAEATNSGITAWNADGYTLGSSVGINANSVTAVSWNWKAGTTGSGNTGGSGTYKTYNYSVNTTAGFSIVKYVGNGTGGHTIPHHLGVAPSNVIIKAVTTNSWISKFKGADGYFYLDENHALTSNSTWLPTDATKLTLANTWGAYNTNDVTYVAFCFAEKVGYSSFGRYDGNGNVNGNFLYTGMKPSLFIVKRYDTTGNWGIFDNKRSSSGGLNTVDYWLNPDLHNVEGTSSSAMSVDFVSNGVKIREDNGDLNTNGGDYVYMAFGQSLVGSNNVPCTAR